MKKALFRILALALAVVLPALVPTTAVVVSGCGPNPPNCGASDPSCVCSGAKTGELAIEAVWAAVYPTIPPSEQAQAEQDWNAARMVMDAAVTEICDVVAAVAAGQKGDLAGAEQKGADALACLICIVDLFMGQESSCACAKGLPGVASAQAVKLDPATQSNLSTAQTEQQQLAQAAGQ